MRRHIYYTLQSLLHKQGSNAIKIVSLALEPCLCNKLCNV